MAEARVLPNAKTYTAAMSALSRAGRPRAAVSLAAPPPPLPPYSGRSKFHQRGFQYRGQGGDTNSGPLPPSSRLVVVAPSGLSLLSSSPVASSLPLRSVIPQPYPPISRGFRPSHTVASASSTFLLFPAASAGCHLALPPQPQPGNKHPGLSKTIHPSGPSTIPQHPHNRHNAPRPQKLPRPPLSLIIRFSLPSPPFPAEPLLTAHAELQGDPGRPLPLL